MFLGRKKELEVINECLQMKSVSLMVYGKRKIGKTTLISHALKKHSDKLIYFECLKAPMQDNVDALVSILVRENILSARISFKNFIDLFSHLNSINQTLNIVIDEYPYLKVFTEPQTVDSIFQNIIDNYIGNIRLFISGSHVGMMKDLLAESNALYGRFRRIICLKELDYKTTAAFYSDKSPYDKVAFYSVFGGSPYINELINPSHSLRENIIKEVLNPSSAIYHYADSLLLSDLSTSANMERILYAIANGKKKYSDIQNKLSMNGNGLLSKQMNILLDMELVTKISPINRLDDNKKAHYEITDNLLRFFYTYVYSNKSALQILGAEAFYDVYVAPTITTFISHRFEELCRTYFSLQAQNGKLKGVFNIGTYYYDDAKAKTNGEFDVALQRRDETYDIYEVKYLSSPMSEKQMQMEVEQVKHLKGLSVGSIGFISVNGFENSNSPYHCISGDDLYL